jgi:hypothetical protein
MSDRGPSRSTIELIPEAYGTRLAHQAIDRHQTDPVGRMPAPSRRFAYAFRASLAARKRRPLGDRRIGGGRTPWHMGCGAPAAPGRRM